jgi:dsRNA-specific ribonuclease
MMKQEKTIYSLIPLEEFKALLGVDDREDKLARFCLTTATYTIEQYCMRRFLRKKYFERIEFFGDLIFGSNSGSVHPSKPNFVENKLPLKPSF